MKEYSVFIISVIGNVREKNEDNFYFHGEYRNIKVTQESVIYKKVSANDSYMLAVFDGMGGEQKGELASYLSARVLREYEIEIKNAAEKQIDLSEAIYKLNNAVCEMAKKRNCTMGSTAVIMEINGRQAKVCNVGDSRAYVYRNGDLKQLSEDHTVAADSERMCKALGIDLIDLGTMSTNLLTQHLGVETDEFVLEPAMSNTLEIKENDIYLICSDGLTHFVKEEDICEVLKRKESINEKGETLKKMALTAGSNDNITIILFEAD